MIFCDFFGLKNLNFPVSLKDLEIFVCKFRFSMKNCVYSYLETPGNWVLSLFTSCLLCFVIFLVGKNQFVHLFCLFLKVLGCLNSFSRSRSIDSDRGIMEIHGVVMKNLTFLIFINFCYFFCFKTLIFPVSLQDLASFVCKIGFYVKNCVYSYLEMSGNQNFRFCWFCFLTSKLGVPDISR